MAKYNRLHPHDPAYPATDPNGNEYSGLTVREYFAAQAMHGLLAGDHPWEPEAAARMAVLFSDALLSELNRTDDGL